MKMPWKIGWHQIAVSLLIGFALGTAFGQWHAKENFRPPWKEGGMQQHLLNRLDKKLHLSQEQKRNISAIFAAKHPEMMALHAEMRPKFEALRHATQTEIRNLLTPDQQEKFEEMNARMEKRWKKHKPFPDA